MLIELLIGEHNKDLYPNGLEQAHPGEDAAFDLKSAVEATIFPGQVAMIGTGIRTSVMSVPQLTEAGIYETPNVRHKTQVAMVVCPRSSASRIRLGLANTIGVIDSGYQNEWLCSVVNHGDKPLEIRRGDRIAQVMFVPVFIPQFRQVERFSEESARGQKGFGSSGGVSKMEGLKTELYGLEPVRAEPATPYAMIPSPTRIVRCAVIDQANLLYVKPKGTLLRVFDETEEGLEEVVIRLPREGSFGLTCSPSGKIYAEVQD